MTRTISYGYATGDLLQNRNTYFYTKYLGRDFISAWHNQREAVRIEEYAPGKLGIPARKTPVDQLLDEIGAALSVEDARAHALSKLNRLLQRFEVSKRLHGAYNDNWRPIDPDDYHSLERYVRFAEVLSLAYASTSALPHLNALLKCMDTLIALRERLDSSQRQRMQQLIALESAHTDLLAQKSDTLPHRKVQAPTMRKVANTSAQELRGVVLFAAQTARSQAYIQALIGNGLRPEAVIILGEDRSQEALDENQPSSWQGIALPDLAEPVSLTCDRAGIPFVRCPGSDVNADETVQCIKSLAPRIVIYSGVGGQIVSDRTLGLGAAFLHIHSGWLPEYRGSTTLYYALLNDELPGVTALVLDRTIDTGPVVERQYFPKPTTGMDIDLIYDSAVRADLMVQVMRKYAASNELPLLERQSPNQGVTYYVIHPVLKHLAILSLPRNEASCTR